MSNKRPLILLSGGVDSTYLCQLSASDNKPFDTLYVDGGQGKNKITAEKRAVKAIREFIAGEYDDNMVGRHLEPATCLNLNNDFGCRSTAIRFSQALPWFMAALQVYDPQRHSCVRIGYLAGDQIAADTHLLTTAWNALTAVVKNGDRIPLEFPLIVAGSRKASVMKALRQKLYALTWVCELPEWWEKEQKVVPCLECDACITRKVEEYRYKLTYNQDFTLNAYTLEAEAFFKERKAEIEELRKNKELEHCEPDPPV